MLRTEPASVVYEAVLSFQPWPYESFTGRDMNRTVKWQGEGQESVSEMMGT